MGYRLIDDPIELTLNETIVKKPQVCYREHDRWQKATKRHGLNTISLTGIRTLAALASSA
jgi:hypothetical protein